MARVMLYNACFFDICGVKLLHPPYAVVVQCVLLLRTNKENN